MGCTLQGRFLEVKAGKGGFYENDSCMGWF